MDEIIRAVRDCPSGALNLAFDRTEDRDLADWHGRRQPAIEVSADGPYRVTGGIPLGAAGEAEITRAAGSSREHYALCRCGHSQNKPFCSGMHWYVQFRDPPRPAGPTLFEWAGGLPALTRMTRILYEKLLPADDLLAPAFAELPPGHCGAGGGVAGRGVRRTRAGWRDSARGPRPHPRAAGAMGRAGGCGGGPGPPAGRPGVPRGAGRFPRLHVASAGQHRGDVPDWDWGPGGPPEEPGSSRYRRRPSRALRCPGRTRRSGSSRMSGRCSASMTGRPCCSRSTCGHPPTRSQHAAEILDRLRDGTMPCDGAWPQAWTEVFRRWSESGFQP